MAVSLDPLALRSSRKKKKKDKQAPSWCGLSPDERKKEIIRGGETLGFDAETIFEATPDTEDHDSTLLDDLIRDLSDKDGDLRYRLKSSGFFFLYAKLLTYKEELRELQMKTMQDKETIVEFTNAVLNQSKIVEHTINMRTPNNRQRYLSAEAFWDKLSTNYPDLQANTAEISKLQGEIILPLERMVTEYGLAVQEHKNGLITEEFKTTWNKLRGEFQDLQLEEKKEELQPEEQEEELQPEGQEEEELQPEGQEEEEEEEDDDDEEEKTVLVRTSSRIKIPRTRLGQRGTGEEKKETKETKEEKENKSRTTRSGREVKKTTQFDPVKEEEKKQPRRQVKKKTSTKKGTKKTKTIVQADSKRVDTRLDELQDELIKLKSQFIGRQQVTNSIATLVYTFANNWKVLQNSFINFALLGGPGLGKTTIGKSVGRILARIGLLMTDRFSEITRGDLVGGHLGETAIKTNQLLVESMESVLFLDEAYSLSVTPGDSYAAEAIATLVNFLDKHKTQLVFMVAGYTDEMLCEFFPSNPGLRRRFPFLILLRDYTPEESYQIFLRFMQQFGYGDQQYTPEAKNLLIDVFKTPHMNKALFGNSAGDIELFSNQMANFLAFCPVESVDRCDMLYVLTRYASQTKLLQLKERTRAGQSPCPRRPTKCERKKERRATQPTRSRSRTPEID